MKYKLLSIASNDVINIGDYVQALAAAQFLPQIDGFVDRERMNDYDDEPCKLIMNGWFMHHPKNWPPSKNIFPLFLAFHLNSSVEKEMLSPEGVEYLKKFSPIGCRDLNTVRTLTKKGIKSFFTGCMTLTLGCKYYSEKKEDKWYFVDPLIYSNRNLKNLIKSVVTFMFNPKSCFAIAKSMNSSKVCLKNVIKAASIIKIYSKMFTKETLLKAIYICQESAFYKNNFKTDEDRLKEAERLVKMYAKAKFVVSSRIHCALPCLGLETPVLFLKRKNDEEISSCRFEGLQELFNVVEFDETNLTPNFEQHSKYIDRDFPKNKDLWKNLAADLIKKCKSFVTDP